MANPVERFLYGKLVETCDTHEDLLRVLETRVRPHHGVRVDIYQKCKSREHGIEKSNEYNFMTGENAFQYILGFIEYPTERCRIRVRDRAVLVELENYDPDFDLDFKAKVKAIQV